MLHLVFHPNLNGSKFNKSFAETFSSKSGVEFHDIYSLYPDFKIDAQKEQEKWLNSDEIIIQFPIQWYSPTPMVLKYFEVVLAYGFAYGGEFKLEGKKIYIVTSLGGDRKAYSNGFGLDEILMPMQKTFEFCKMSLAHSFPFFQAFKVSDQVVQNLISDVFEHIKK